MLPRSLIATVPCFSETHDLEAIEFPDELLRPGDPYVGAGVAQYRPQGAAWAQYAVLFALVALVASGEQQSASRP